MLYEMLTGELPFEAVNSKIMAHSVLAVKGGGNMDIQEEFAQAVALQGVWVSTSCTTTLFACPASCTSLAWAVARHRCLLANGPMHHLFALCVLHNDVGRV